MNNTISVSLILPSLNVADYIDETLQSAVDQTLTNIEIICVDAGSTDGTLEIIEKYAKDDSRIRIIHSDKRSYGYQVNKGIESAKGDYIAVLETDDFVEPDMYKILYNLAVKESLDYVKADYNAFFTQSDGSYYYFPRSTFKDKSLYDRVMRPTDHPCIGRDDWYLWQGIYSRKFLNTNDIRFSETPGAAFQDIGFLFWTGLYAQKALYTQGNLYHYRIDRESASSNLGKGLSYSFNEFKLIKEKIAEIENIDINGLYMLYARMIKSFVSSYSRISEDEDSIEKRSDIYEWFKNEIIEAEEKGCIKENLILSGHKDRLSKLKISEQLYFNSYSINKLLEFIKDREEFAIFGCGDFGFKAYRFLRLKKKRINSFFDNNSELWGKSIDGAVIKSPAELLSVPTDVSYIIANEAHYEEIRDQLLQSGINSDKIEVFR